MSTVISFFKGVASGQNVPANVSETDPLPVKSVSYVGAVVSRVSGSTTTPGASAVIADTAALAAGTYDIKVTVGYADTLVAGKIALIQYRNAANSATTNEQGCPAGASMEYWFRRLTVAANERVRVINGVIAGAAGSVLNAYIEVFPAQV